MPTIVIILLAQPVVATMLLVLLHRSRSLASLVPALVLSGISCALLTPALAFMTSTAPIAPYEDTSSYWIPFLWQTLLSMYVGFGLGAFISATIGVPYWYFSGRTAPSIPSASRS